jgi:hypothetical protein
VFVTAALAATVTIANTTATASWLGLSQPAVATPSAINAPTAYVGAVAPYEFKWSTIPTASAYRIWLDGKPISIVPAETGVTESRLLAVSCGVIHRWNVQGLNGKGVGPLAAKPVYFTPPCP